MRGLIEIQLSMSYQNGSWFHETASLVRVSEVDGIIGEQDVLAFLRFCFDSPHV